MNDYGYKGEQGDRLWGWDDGSVLYRDETRPRELDGSVGEYDVTSDPALCARICALIRETLDARNVVHYPDGLDNPVPYKAE